MMMNVDELSARGSAERTRALAGGVEWSDARCAGGERSRGWCVQALSARYRFGARDTFGVYSRVSHMWSKSVSYVEHM